MRRLFSPSTKQEIENPIKVLQNDFSAGMFLDIPNIPDNGVYWLKNYINFGNRLVGRGGSKKWTNTTLPKYNSTDYTYTSTVAGTTRTITKSVGDNFLSTDVGNYFVHGDGTHEKITALTSTTIIETYTAGGAKSGTATGWLRGKNNGMYFHKAEGKIVAQFGSKLYISTDISMSAWTEIVYNGAENELSNTASTFSASREYVLIFNESGIYKVDVSTSPYVYFQINNSVPTVRIGDKQVEGTSYPYGYKYLYTLVRLSGTTVTRDRNTSGVKVELETGSVKINTNGIDFGAIWVLNPISTSNPSLAGSDATGMFRVPTETGNTVPNSQYTHYGVYRTLDTGDNGIDPVNGSGNNSELFIWVKDIPIAKAFTITTTGTSCVASSGTFASEDAGSKLAIYITGAPDAVTEYTINSYTNPTTVVLSGSPAVTDAPAALGGQVTVDGTGAKVLYATQATTTVTIHADYRDVEVFESTDVGSMLVFADGTRRYITAVAADGYSCTVDTSGTVATQGATLRCEARKFYDSMPDDPIVEGDVFLRSQIAGWVLQNRFWTELPSCNLGCTVPGFMFTADYDDKFLYYNQLPTNYEYMVGYYNPAYQYAVMKDKIRALSEMPDKLVVYCLSSTYVIPTNLYGSVETPEVGEVVMTISGQHEVDNSIGVLNINSIQPITIGQELVVTSEPAIRIFDGVSYSEDLSRHKIGSILKSLNTSVTTCYDRLNGYTIYGLAGSATHGGTDTSYRFGVKEVQGIGFSENTGTSFPFPEAGHKMLKVLDSYDQEHALVLDYTDGYFYDISTDDGYTSSGNSKVWKDKVAVAGTGGTDVAPSVMFKPDTAVIDHMYVTHTSSAIGISPIKPSNRGASGYGAEGFPTSFQLDMDIYEDGEETTSTATATDISQSEEMCFDRDASAHSLQTKITANKAEHQLTHRIQYYIQKDAYVDPASRVTTEGSYQDNLSEPALWITRGGNLLYDRIGQTTITGAGTGTTGPDARSLSALTITTALEPGNTAYASGILLFWCKSTYVTAFQTANSVTLTEVDNNGTWYLYYVSAVPANLVFQAGDVFDIRVYAATIDSSTRSYLYNDIISNAGSATLPLF